MTKAEIEAVLDHARGRNAAKTNSPLGMSRSSTLSRAGRHHDNGTRWPSPCWRTRSRTDHTPTALVTGPARGPDCRHAQFAPSIGFRYRVPIEGSRAVAGREAENHELLSGLIRLHILHHAVEDGLYGQWMIGE